MPEQRTFGAKQVARRIGTDAKTFRKWLRSEDSPYIAVGQGSRYEFPVEDLNDIRNAFNEWVAQRTPIHPESNGHAV